MKNNFVYLLLCLLGNAFGLWAQTNPLNPVIYPAFNGTNTGAIEQTLPPSVAGVEYFYHWFKEGVGPEIGNTLNIYHLEAGNYTLNINRGAWCSAAVYQYTVPSVSSGTAPQLRFIPGYDAVKVKVINGTATKYRLLKRLTADQTTDDDSGWVDITDVTGDGVETIENGIESQEAQQYFIVPLGSEYTNYFRILVQMSTNCIVDSHADVDPKSLDSFSSTCSRQNMVQDMKACLRKDEGTSLLDPTPVDNFYNEKCEDDLNIFKVSLKFPPNSIENVPTIQGDNIDWEKSKNEYHFTLQKLDGSYITDPISTEDTNDDGSPSNFLTTRISTDIILDGTNPTGQVKGRLWCTAGTGTGGVHNGCTAAGIMSCGDHSYVYPAFGSTADAFMKDCTDDDGLDAPGDVPITPCHPTESSWYNIWESPDLWYNSDALGANSPNPEWIDNDGYIHVRMRNRDAQKATAPGKIVLYWTVASTGEVWSEDWVDDGIDDCVIGNIIGKIDVPPIPAGTPQGQVFDFHWTSLPNSGTTNPTNCAGQMNTISGGNIEMCLLARFISELDPIADERLNEDLINYNVTRNNNIVTRNTVYMLPGLYIGGVLVPGIPSVIHIKNNNNFATQLNFLVQSVVKLSTAQQSQYYFDLVFTQSLWDKWTSTGSQGIGVTILEDKLVRITNFNTAKLLNIPMLANERQGIGLRLTRIGTGKNDNFTPNPDFKLIVTHEASDPNTIIAPPSSCILLERENKALQTAHSTNIQLYPNPATNQLTVSGHTTTGKHYLTLHDVIGRTVLQQLLQTGDTNLSIAHLPTGLYVYEIRNEQNELLGADKLTIIR